jgi:hypothetical protein
MKINGKWVAIGGLFLNPKEQQVLIMTADGELSAERGHQVSINILAKGLLQLLSLGESKCRPS